MEACYRQALAHCVRASLGAGSSVSIPPGIDPERLVLFAEDHNLMPALTAGLRAGSGLEPELARWRSRWTRASLSLAAELARVLDCLATGGVRAMPLKGPVLADILHGDFAARQYSDLDLIVERGQLEAALAALRGGGYLPRCPTELLERERRFNWWEEISLRGSAGVDLDLHWAFTVRHYPARMDEASVWRRARHVEFLGRTVQVPAHADYFEFLCLHGTRHEWCRLGWLADIAAYWLRYRNEIGLTTLVRHSESGEFVARGMRLAADWLDLAVPELDGTAARPISPARKLRYWAATAFLPTEADWAGVNLPPALDSLYYPLRLGRLASRNLGRLLQRGLGRFH